MFGIDLDPGHILPPDQTVGDGFDNDANLLTVEPLWFERSLEAADETVQAVWRDNDALSRLLVAHPSPPPPAESAQYVIPPELAGTYDTGDGNFTVLARILGNPLRLFLRAPPRLSFGCGTRYHIGGISPENRRTTTARHGHRTKRSIASTSR